MLLMARRRPSERQARPVEAVLRELRREMRALRGALNPEPPEAPLLLDYVVDWSAEYATRGNKPATLAHKRKLFVLYILPALGRRRLDEIDAAAVVDLKKQMASAPGSVNNALSLLRMVLRDAVTAGLIEKVPTIRNVRMPKRKPHFHGLQAYERLLAAGRKLGRHVYLALLLAGDAGLRNGEIAGLCWENCNLGTRIISVVEQSTDEGQSPTKNGNERDVPMTRLLAECLHEMGGPVCGRILRDRKGRPVNIDHVYYWFRKAAWRAGIPTAGGIHALRHSMVSGLLSLGAPVTAVRDIAGHHSITVTNLYAHAEMEILRAAVGLLDAVRNTGKNGGTPQ